MSVFSIIKRSRQQAKEHSVKQAEKEKLEAEKVPYKHVPTHAAVDALSGAPSSWRQDDRSRIIEAHRRRSAMAASGPGLGMPSPIMNPVHMGMPRVNSSLSHVSYPANFASPVVQVPRAYSYNGVQPLGWNHRGGEVVYSAAEHGGHSAKGKEVERVAIVDSGRASRTSSKAHSPVGSSSNSTSSQDDLEMKPVKRVDSSHAPADFEAKPSRVEHLHRLHPQARRISDPPIMSGYVPQPVTSAVPASTRPAAARPPVATAVAVGIPPVPALPPMQFGSLSSSLTGVALSTVSQAATTPGTTVSATSWAGVPNLSTPSSISSYYNTATPASVAEEVAETDYFSSQPVGTAVTTPSLAHKSRRISKNTRFNELTTINSHVDPPKMPVNEKGRIVVETRVLPTEFDESSFAPVTTPQESLPRTPVAHKSGKLSKTPGAKLNKKNRWSLRGSKQAPVAV